MCTEMENQPASTAAGVIKPSPARSQAPSQLWFLRFDTYNTTS